MATSRGGQIEHANDLVRVLERLRQQRVRLWSENGKLHYKAPRGVLNEADIEVLRTHHARIVGLMRETAQRSMPRLERRNRSEHVPLTFSQFKYWHAEKLSERATIRSVAAATRLSGTLHPTRLCECIEAIVDRHESLRTRIVTVFGTPEQHVAESCSVQTTVHDLSALPEDRHAAEVERLIHAIILAPVHIDVGPLFAAALIRLRDDVHILVVTLEHIISDGFSVGVLLRDVVTAYTCESSHRELALPAIAIQFADYAVWQSKAHPVWLELHGAYWAKRLAGCERVRFPADEVVADPLDKSSATLTVCIDGRMRRELGEWCRVMRTTPAMTVFAAFAAAVIRSCGTSEAVIRFQSDGRFSALLENSIGYFACVLNLRVELRDSDSFIEFLERVTNEYCAASEHADLSYFDARVPRPEFTRNSAFNWVPQPLGAIPGGVASPESLSARPYPFTMPRREGVAPEWDFEPSILLFDSADAIQGSLIFSRARHSPARIESFRVNLLALVREAIRDPRRRVSSILFK